MRPCALEWSGRRALPARAFSGAAARRGPRVRSPGECFLRPSARLPSASVCLAGYVGRLRLAAIGSAREAGALVLRRGAPPAPLNRALLSHSHFACCRARPAHGAWSRRRLAVTRSGRGEDGTPPFHRDWPRAGQRSQRSARGPANRSVCSGPPRANLKGAVGSSEARNRVSAASSEVGWASEGSIRG